MYSSAHPETVEDLLEWPYRRWRTAFAAWQQRRLRELLDSRRDLHVAAIYSNTNWDDEKNNREEHIKTIEEYYEVLKSAYTKPSDQAQREEEELRAMEENDPFLQASRRNLARSAQVVFPGESSIQQVM